MNNMGRLEKILSRIAILIFGSIELVLTLLSICSTAFIDDIETTVFKRDNICLNILTLVIIAAISAIVRFRCCGKDSRLQEKTSHIIFLTVAVINIVLMTLWIMITRLSPTLDQKSVLDIAAEMLNGDYSAWNAKGYMFYYPFQNGIVIYYYMLFKITGTTGYILPQLLNVVYYAISMFALYKITCIVSRSQRIGRLSYYVMVIWVPLAMYTTFIYGTIPGFMFSVLSIMLFYYYIDKRKFIYAVMSILSMVVACILKSNYSISLIALLIFMMADFIHTKDKKSIVFVILTIIMLAAGTKGINKLTESITGKPTPDGIPKVAWAAMGLSNSNDLYGWWDGYNLFVYNKNDLDYDMAQKEAAGKVKGLVQTYAEAPVYGAKFFAKKTISIWCNPAFQGIQIQKSRLSDGHYPKIVESVLLDDGAGNKALYDILNLMQTVIYAGAFLWAVFNYKDAGLYSLTIPIIFIGGFLFHIVWEAKAQYTVTYFYMLIPYAVMGWSSCGKAISEKLKEVLNA